CSLGSLTGNEASRGALAHALTSSAVTQAAAHLLHNRARRIYFFLAPMTGLARRKWRQPRCMPLARRIKPIRVKLPVALRADCCFFAAFSDFAATPLHQARRFCACVAISAGWKMTAAATVVRSESAISLPMLDVPG